MPKPKAYPKIEWPIKKYSIYSNNDCPFTFEIPTYSMVERDTLFFNEKVDNPCWLNIQFKQFSGTIHLSYEDVNSEEEIAKRLDDAHKLTYKHTQKADHIDPLQIDNKNGVKGVLFDVGGNAASSLQFYLTDEEKHFLRGALYFNVAPNIDSMQPVVDFIRLDLDHLLGSFQWKDRN